MASITSSTRTTTSIRNATSLSLYRIHFTYPGTKVDFDEYAYGESPEDAIDRFLSSRIEWYKFNATATKVEVRS